MIADDIAWIKTHTTTHTKHTRRKRRGGRMEKRHHARMRNLGLWKPCPAFTNASVRKNRAVTPRIGFEGVCHGGRRVDGGECLRQLLGGERIKPPVPLMYPLRHRHDFFKGRLCLGEQHPHRRGKPMAVIKAIPALREPLEATQCLKRQGIRPQYLIRRFAREAQV